MMIVALGARGGELDSLPTTPTKTMGTKTMGTAPHEAA